MQQLLDDWNFISPQLEDLYTALNSGKPRHAFPFDPRQCMAPLPRAYQWADGSAYLNHVQRVRRARGAELPADWATVPLMYQGGSDDFLGPCDDALFADEAGGIDFEAELAAITGDIGMRTPADSALEGIRLLLLANDWTLRNRVPGEVARGFGFLHSKPATAFSPVAATPDELGAAWHGGRLHLALECHWNGVRFGHCDAGAGMTFHFGELVAHLAATRNVRAGSIVGSGTVSSSDPAQGCGCIAERRAIETIEAGTATTEFMKFGDRIRIEMTGTDGVSVFGAIDQRVAGVSG
jgi:fumarylacetoacetate (FAA) hydrolase